MEKDRPHVKKNNYKYYETRYIMEFTWIRNRGRPKNTWSREFEKDMKII